MSQTLGTILGTILGIILVTILVTILVFPMKFGSYGVVVAGANRSVTLMVDAVQKLRWFVHEDGSFTKLKYVSVRKWCSAGCRDEARRKQARAIFDEWLRAPLPECCPDLEGALLDAAPDGAWWYRLSCPGMGNGVPRYFPAGSRWQLRMFEEPAVPWPGYYTACFYDEHDRLIGMVEQSVIGQGTERARIGSGDHSLHIRP